MPTANPARPVGVDTLLDLKQNKIQLGALNVSGLKKRLNYPEFIELVNNFDIFCLSETHTDTYDIIELKNYKFLAKHREQEYKRKSGGIGIFVKDTLTPFVNIIQSNTEYILWISICKTITKLDENILIGAVYVPPEHSRFF